MSQRRRTICRPAVVALLLLVAAVPALAQLQTGDIYVKVQDEKGQSLPGATVTVTGIGAPRAETSNAEGQVHFLGLHPGSYALKGELEGFSTVDYPGISVTIGGKAQLVLTLSSSVKETITVTADAPLLDERKTNRGAVISTKDLNNIPTARDPWSLLGQAPGVQQDRINVGGNESGQQSDFLGVGSTGRDNTFAVDGVIVSDMNAVGGSATYFDFGAFDEVQITVSSADVTVATSGVTVNQVTKRGTNEIKANARYLRTDGNLQSAPGRVNTTDFLTGNSEVVDGNKIRSVSEYGGDVGGPLWRDHLWGWVSYGRSDINNIVVGGEPDDTQLKDFNSKVDFQAGDADSGVIHYWTNNKLKEGRDAGPGFAPAATFNQTTPSKFLKLEDTYLLGKDFYITGLWSNDSGGFTLAPQGGPSPFIFIDPTGTITGTNLDFKQTAIIQQERLSGSYFFNTGKASNELKFGGSYRHQDNRSSTTWPHGYEVQSCEFAGVCDPTDPNLEEIEFFRDRNVNIRSEYTSAWLQDTWSLGNWTVNAGARLDDQTMRNRAAFGAANPVNPLGLLPALNFTGNDDGGYVWHTIVPRIGVTYAVGQDRKTLLRGTFSQYAEQLGQIPLATRANPIGYSYAYFTFDDLNHNHQLDPNEIGSLVLNGISNINPANPGSLATPDINDPHLKPARTNELTAGIDQGLGRDYLATFTLTYRHIDQIPEDRILVTDQNGVTRFANVNDWIPVGTVSGPLPNGKTGMTTVYDLNPALTPTGGTFYTNGDRTQRYIGGTLTFTKRLSDNWQANGHFTVSNWTWHIGPQYTFYHDPTLTVADDLGYAIRDGDYFEQSTGSGNKGDVFIGSRWSYNANAMYQVAPSKAWGFDVTAAVQGRQGYPTPPYVNDSSGPLGVRHILLASSVDEFRNPDIFDLDGRISKDFNFKDFGLTIGIDGFNLLNAHTVLQIQRNTGVSTALQTEEVLSPRIFRLGAIFHFR
ncbi:MAG TPA: carboxypeptidase regulatory-like domain-containing protein [Thermoanaerobaculia bacterium]|jgi:hypothetical protein|nr:carboxypeptidase regulatory-like domain-containing protein [Thermoanaerobaculia bacterium]